LYHGPDLDDLHLVARHGPVVGAHGLHIHDQVIAMRDPHVELTFDKQP
jgi:hypothetical protein